jgi:hypothetical protein
LIPFERGQLNKDRHLLYVAMTPVSGALSLFGFLFFAWTAAAIGSVEKLARRDVPRVELIGRSAGGGIGERLERRGNASVEYLRYATQ